MLRVSRTRRSNPLSLCSRVSALGVLYALSVTGLADDPSETSWLDSLADALAETTAVLSSGIEALDPSLRNSVAPSLAAWIEATRDEALGIGVTELPGEAYAIFAGHVPPGILEQVRWRVDDTNFSLQQGLFLTGYTQALTVGHVVLFADAQAAGSLANWAHEMAHVMQYQEWGIDGFVQRYLDDYAAVEHAANEQAWQWLKAASLSPAGAAAD